MRRIRSSPAAAALHAAAFAALLAAGGAPAAAAPAPQEAPADKFSEFRRMLAERRKEPWLAKGGWYQDFAEASKRARETGQAMMFYAARSHMVDTQARGLEARIFATDEFRAMTKDVVLYIHFITKLPDDNHLEIARRSGYYGTPYAACIDPDGNPISALPDRTLEGFRKMIQGAQEFRRIEARIASGEATESERAHNLLRLAESNRAKAAEIRERLAEWKTLTPQEVETLRSWYFEISVREDLNPGSELSKQRGDPLAFGRKYAKFVAEGYTLPKNNHTGFSVMAAVVDYAVATKDLGLFDKAATPLVEWYRLGGAPFAREEPRIQALRAKLVADLAAAGTGSPKTPAPPPEGPKPAPGGDAPPK